MDINKIITRAKSMLLSPRAEWPLVAAEPDTVGGVYSGYIIMLAAIPAMVHFLSSTLIGVSVPFLGSFRVPIAAGVTTAILAYVLSLIGTYIVALIVDALAPSFGAEKNRVQALKTVAYSYTAYWVASIMGIIPGLGLLAAVVGGIYSIYLLNMGLPFTMKCPPDKSIGYTAVSIIVAIVIGWVLALVVGSVAGLGLGIGRGLAGYTGSSIPGYSRPSGGEFAPGTTGAALQAWGKKMAGRHQADGCGAKIRRYHGHGECGRPDDRRRGRQWRQGRITGAGSDQAVPSRCVGGTQAHTTLG